MHWYLGVDGGGTRTRAFALGADGRGAWGEAGLSNPNHAARATLVENLNAAIELASGELGVGRDECRTVFVGMAGVTTADGRAFVRDCVVACGLKADRVMVDHDIRIALAGGLAGRPGIALIAGTGSSCYGRTGDGRTWQTGGWEALISDEGSGYYLGREAMAAAARMADGRAEETPLRERVFSWLGITEVAQILPRIHDRGLSRTDIAAFAPEVIKLAEAGDLAAEAIVAEGARLLAELVVGNHRRLPTGPGPDVVVTGGLGTAATTYRDKVYAAIRRELPSANVHAPELAPAIGAAMLALQEDGVALSPELINNLRRYT